MPLQREAPAENSYDRPFIPQGAYLATITEVRDTDDNGAAFTKSFTDKKTNEVKVREAVVIVFRIDEVLVPGQWPDQETYDLNVARNPAAPVGDTMGKKLTDSLAKSANLRKVFEDLTGIDVDASFGGVDLEALVSKRAIIKTGGSEQYNPAGQMQRRHWIEDINPYFVPGSAPAAPVIRGTSAAAPAVVAPANELALAEVPF